VLNVNSIPFYALWLHFISVHTYLYNGAILNQFEFWNPDDCGIADPCDPVDFLNIDMTMGEAVMGAIGFSIVPYMLCLLALMVKSKAIRKQTK
jgi:hypothetical protein